MGLIGGPTNLLGGGKGNLLGGGNGGLPMPGCSLGNPNRLPPPGANLVMKDLLGGTGTGTCCTALSALLKEKGFSFCNVVSISSYCNT